MQRRIGALGVCLVIGLIGLGAPAPADELALAAAQADETRPDEGGLLDEFLTFDGFGETHRWDGFIMPIAMPYFWEDPFITTGVHALGIRNEFPKKSLFKGGYVNVAALEARLALNRRVGIIAPRDGYFWFHPGSRSAVGDVNGFGDISIGLKAAVLERPEDDFILSAGVLYRSHFGSHDVFSGHGEGAVNSFLAFGKGFGKLKFIGHFGGEFPFDGDKNSTFLTYGIQASYGVTEKIHPLVTLSGLHYLDGGRRLPLNQEGVDVVNLGSDFVENNDLVFAGLGFRYEFNRHVGVGFLWERPLTDREDIFDQRFTLSLRLEL